MTINKYQLPGNGLRPGIWDILVDRIISEVSAVHGNKNQTIRIELIKNTTWNEILKLLPHGSIIKSIRQAR